MFIPWKLLEWARKNGAASVRRRGLFGLEVQFYQQIDAPGAEAPYEPPGGLTEEERAHHARQSRDNLDFYSS